MCSKQVGKQVVLIVDEEQAEELYLALKADYGESSVVYDEIYEALQPVME